MQAFTSRVKQLEEFIVAQGLQVPLPDPQHALTIESLVTAYQSPNATPATDQGCALPTNGLATDHSAQSRLRLEDNNQPNMPGQASLFADIIPEYQMGSELNEESADLSADFNADWMLSLTSSDALYGDFGIDTTTSTIPMNFLNNNFDPHSHFDEPTLEQYSQHADPTSDDDASSRDEEDHKDVTGQISNRTGTLLDTDKGNWRFYGATSILSLSKDTPTPPFKSKGLCQRERMSAQLSLLELNHDFEAEILQELTELFFAWQNPSSNMVHRGTFDRAREIYLEDGEETTFYSELLVSAMYVLDNPTRVKPQRTQLTFRQVCSRSSVPKPHALRPAQKSARVLCKESKSHHRYRTG